MVEVIGGVRDGSGMTGKQGEAVGSVECLTSPWHEEREQGMLNGAVLMDKQGEADGFVDNFTSPLNGFGREFDNPNCAIAYSSTSTSVGTDVLSQRIL